MTRCGICQAIGRGFYKCFETGRMRCRVCHNFKEEE